MPCQASEIIDRSGLLSDVSDAGRYVFAHRSIHEHLAAEELRLLGDGAVTLLTRAGDAEWRQVILFYATALEQRDADGFLRGLVTRNRALAAHCLAGAKPSNEVAEAVLDALPADDPAHLAALISATMSPRTAVQEMAVHRLEAQLSRSVDDVAAAFGGDADGMLPLLGSLAGSNAARIAALVPRIAGGIMDDPRLVEPLWRCLAASGIEEQPACRTIVERLLTIAMEPDGLAELERQESYTRPFLTDAVRRRAYPFTSALPATSNLVTLLAWAEYLKVTPAQPNRFFEAKAADRLTRVETDKRRSLSVCLFWPGRVISVAAIVLSVAATITLLVMDWRILLHPWGWWSPLVALITAVTAFGFFIAMLAPDGTPPSSWRQSYFGINDDDAAIAHFAYKFHDFHDSMVLSVVALFLGPGCYAVAVMPLAAVSITWYVVAAVLGAFVLMYLPIFELCSRTTRLRLYWPPFIDVYDDPRSRPWLVRATKNGHG